MKLIETNFKYEKPLYLLDLNKVQYIVIHHIASEKASPEELHNWGLSMGWSGFPYNDYVRKDGTIYIGRGNKIGAQAKGFNSKSYGIAVEGNYSFEKELPEIQFKALVERIKQLKQLYIHAKIIAHRDLLPTECPGTNFPMQKLLDALKEQPKKQTFYFENEKVNFNNKLIDGTNYVPLRELFEFLGYNVDFNNETLEININKI